MRIAVVCNDTRGGIQPYLNLAIGLQRAGHEVRVVAPADFAPMIAAMGLSVAALSGSVEAAIRGSGGMTERGTLASMRFAARELPARIHAWTRETLAACAGVDVMTGGIGGMVVGLSVAEKLRTPFIEAHLQPLGVPTDSYPGVLFGGIPKWFGRSGIRLSHHLSELAVWMPFERAMASARETVLGLSGPPSATDGQPVLYGFSRHVVPVPAGGARSRHVTGYWSTREATAWIPPPALEAWLAGPKPIVSIGFGSMVNRDPVAITKLVIAATRSAGVRAILLAGWGAIESVRGSADVFCIDNVPHDWLFPRIAAVVHHGGAGTTGAALTAGVPAIVVPFTMDQPFWGSRVAALGVGPEPIPRARLTQNGLADALRRVVADDAMRARASALGVLIRSEDGIAAAVDHFDRLGQIRRAAEQTCSGRCASRAQEVRRSSRATLFGF